MKDRAHLSVLASPERKTEWRSIKIGSTSFNVKRETHESLMELRSLINNNLQGAMSHVLDTCTPIVVHLQKKVVKSLWESLRVENEVSPEVKEVFERYCTENNLTEAEAARDWAEFCARFFGNVGVDFNWREEESKGKKRA